MSQLVRDSKVAQGKAVGRLTRTYTASTFISYCLITTAGPPIKER